MTRPPSPNLATDLVVNQLPIAANEQRLRITEIFFSLQGEARDAGWPTVFVRLTGCPLRCHYCDTRYAFFGGEWWPIARVLERVASFGARHVCVTGGEPLAQKRCLQLLEQLCDNNYLVSLETSGAIDISGVDPRVVKVLDLKTPASGEVLKNRWENLPLLLAHDQIKFVIGDRADYEWACGIVWQHALTARCDVLFSPSHGEIAASELAEWILADRLPVRFQLQLHKQLWGEEPGR
ncbi:MAG: 7-carboxy-7-deazaguanine synthase QueE [Lysobacterales bacterium CG02_land_8_20_14_3_00_62_12]|nr:MAG: 7-carboxy-7-deazaguanine synthase QueE [Xanthomonadales bacterium CG02_land_8_20_14_3_00_62_12]